jgi:PelA/Pel-15E family pectate lyase
MTMAGHASDNVASAGSSGAPRWRVPASLAAAIAALALVIWVSSILPWWQIYMMNPDEGINLGKAALVARGVPPYGAMWNDQPPVLTYLLAALQQVLPYDVSAARAVILVTAGLMMWSLYRICYRAGGHPAAIIAAVLLGTAPLFIDLSASVMIGLPAIALAVVALDIASSPIRPLLLRGVLAGVVMALSLQTKLFTFTALPALLVLGWASTEARLSERLKMLGAMLVGLAAAFLLIVLASGEPLFQQLVGTHLSSAIRKSYNLAGSLTAIWLVLQQHLPLLLAAGIGAVIGLPAVLKHGWAPLLWLMVATASLAGHTPIWSHQVLLLIVPLAWLGGIGWAGALARYRQKLLLAVPVLGLLAWSGWSGWAIASRATDTYGTDGRKVAAEFAHFAHLGSIVATDYPMDAFRAGLVVPPEFAVFSLKRVLQEAISPEQVVSVLEAYKPAQASFGRFGVGPALKEYLEDNYWQVPDTEGPPHYIRKGAALAGFDRQAATAGLTEMLNRVVATTVEGGFAGLVDPSTGARYERFATEEPIGARAIAMRPVGSTPRMGQCLLRASTISGNEELRAAAVAAGQAVVCAQSPEGGWSEAPDLRSDCPAVQPPVAPMVTNGSDTLDEGGPVQTIDFLLNLRQSDASEATRFTQSARAAFDFLVNAQNTDGGWPLKLSKGSYSRFSTLNDGVTTEAIRALVEGFELFSDARYRDAALKGVQFLLNVQATNGAWAQQYDETGKPAKARAFEPVAYASLETARAMLTIADFYALTESETLKLSLLTARDWLAPRRMGDAGWARFYEIGTDLPLFGDRDGSVHYNINEISGERAAGYRWIEAFAEIEEALDVAAAAETSAQAVPHVRVRTERDARKLRVTDNHDALVAFSTSRGVGAELDANGMISTRKAVETCEMVLDALEITGI